MYLEESIPCSARRSINLISNSITVFSCVAWILFFFFFPFSQCLSLVWNVPFSLSEERYTERGREIGSLWTIFFFVFFFLFFGGKTEAYRERLSMKSCNTGIIDAMECRSDESIVVFVLWAKDKWQISKCLVSCEQLTSST